MDSFAREAEVVRGRDEISPRIQVDVKTICRLFLIISKRFAKDDK